MQPESRNKVLIAGVVVIVLVSAVTAIVLYATHDDEEVVPLTPAQIVQRVLDRMPIIDGHNDLPWNLRGHLLNDLTKFDFTDLTKVEPWASDRHSHTDLTRLKQGRVGAQFWVAYTSCDSQYKDSVTQTMEQIDVIKRLVKQNSDHMQFATSVADIEDSIKNGKIASLIGVEGGHSMQSSFGILRTLYDMGTRYMTLTHSCNTPWADSSPVDKPDDPVELPENNGLSNFGERVVDEMNRLGMMIDISHVSVKTMQSALHKSKAPVIFSHSSSYTLCNHHRNVNDDVLKLTKEKNSLVMVNFYNSFIKCDGTNATLMDVVEHIEHIRTITGPEADHVGIGGDFDGIEQPAVGLEDVSKYPILLEELYKTGRWSEEDLEKLAGRNLLRVFTAVEKVRDELKQQSAQQGTITRKELVDRKVNLTCITSKFPDDIKDLKSSRRRREVPEEF